MANASPGNEATRRSARKRSAPVLFEAGGARRVRGRKSPDRGGDDTELHEQAPDEDDDDARMDPGDEEGEDDDDEEDVPPKRKNSKSKSGRKSLTSRSKARGKKDKNMNHILLAVRDKRTSLVQVARELIHAEQPGSAGADLVMFILACCGASERAGKRAIPESELFDNKFDLSDKEMKELCKDVATSADCYAETYPLAGGSSEWRDFPRIFGKFWLLVAQEGADAFVTDGDSPVLRFIYDTLEKLAEAPLLSFRHTSVSTMGALGSGLIEVLSEQLERLNKALKQLSTAWTKALGGKQSSNASSSGDFEELEKALKAFSKAPNEENQTTAQEALAKWKKASKAGASKVAVLKSLTSTCKELYDTIAFLYSFLWSMLGDDMLSGRCKDANPVVRIASLQAIGSWVCKMPNYFFSKAKIAVFQALQSSSPKVRVAACRQITALLSQEDEDEDRADIVASVLKEDKQWLRMVSQRVTLLLQNKNAVVGSAAIGTLIAIYRFDPSVVLTEEVQKCLCIEGHEWRSVRIQVAEFCMESVRGLGEPSSSLSTKAKVKDAAVIAKARLQLSSFIELLSQLLENDVGVEDTGKRLNRSPDISEGEDLPVLPSRVMYLVVDAFWTHPQAGFLRNFKAMCAVLRSYGESDASNTIIVYKARMVASTLRAAARRASWLDPEITSKRELKAQTALREDLKASLHEALASTLADCLVAFRSDTVVLEELVPLINNFDPSLCTKDVDRRNLEAVTKTVCQLLGQQSAGSILFSLATVLSRHLCSVAHPSLADALSAQTKAYDASTKDLRRALKAHPESEDEALVALEHASRRFAMLSRVADREYWNTLNTNMRLELKHAALELAKSASDKQRAQSTLSELLLILQLDVTDHVALASEAAQDVELDKDEFVQVLNEAVECRDSLISVLEQTVGLFQSSNNTASLCSLLLPTYLDLRIVCTGRLKGTLLSRLAWFPALSLCEAMDKATELIVKSSSKKAPLAFQGPFAVRQGVVLPSLRVSAYARGPLLSFSKEIFDKVVRIHVEEDDEKDSDDGREEEEENAHSAKMLHSALLEADPSTWGLYAISSLRDYFNSKNRTTTTALAQFLSKELCSRKRSCPDSYVPAIVTIIAEGTKFALSNVDNLMFLDMVKPFVEKLRVKQLQDARLSWKTQLEGMSKPLATAIFAGQQTAKNKHFANFERALGVTTKRAKPVPEDNDTSSSSEDSSSEQEVANEAPERRNKDTAGSVMSDESKKEIEKNLFESDSESVKAAAKRHRMAKRTLSSPGPDDKEDKKNNSDEEKAPADDSGDDDDEFGYGMVPKRQRRD